MATGTNGIATIADCNSIVSGAFSNIYLTGTTFSGTSAISASSYTSTGTTGFKYVHSSTTYYSFTVVCTKKLTITLQCALKQTSNTGPDIYSFSDGPSPKFRVGLTTSSSGTSFSHYVDVTVNWADYEVTNATLIIPPGTWYLRAQCIETGGISGIKTSSTGSEITSGYLYWAWRFQFTLGYDTNYCPTYSIIDETGEFSISGSYEDDQCVKYSDIRVYTPPAGYITYTQNSNKTGNVIGFTYSGSNRFSGSTINDWENFKDQYCGGQYMSTPSTVGTGVYRLTIGSGTTADLAEWQSGYYYLVTAPTNYMVEEIYLTSSEASQLNAGTNLSFSGSGTLLSNY